MGKLGELLKELKKEKSDEKIFKEKKGISKKRFFILVFLGLLFACSLLGGYYLTLLLKPENFKKPKSLITTKRPLPEAEAPPQPIPKPEVSNSQKKDEEKPKIKKEVKRSSETKSLVKKTKTSLEKRPAKVKEKPKNKEEKVETISAKENPPLKESGLLENLIFNAEEERKKGNYLSAIEFYEEYLKYREDPDVLNNLGGIYYLVGNFKAAKTAYKKALKLKYDPLIEVNYIMVLMKTGEIEKACNELFLKNFPPNLQDKIELLKKKCNK
ncbi:MAG: tetratricopeptide repeat protein [Caldimicrobium sp.]